VKPPTNTPIPLYFRYPVLTLIKKERLGFMLTGSLLTFIDTE
jgi:hypothetical protein